MKKYLLSILLLCGVAYAGDVYRVRIPALGIDTTVEVEQVEAPAPEPPPEPEPEPAPDPTPEPQPSAASPTGYEPRVLWNKERQGVYNRMVAENHPLWVHLKTTAESAVKGSPIYGDLGQYCTIAFQATGDKRYARAGWGLVQKTLAGNPDNNTLMMYMGELACCVEWLRPALTDAEIAEATQNIDRWALKTLGVNQPAYTSGFIISDSDAVLGKYLGLATCDRVFGTNYLTRKSEATGFTNYEMGGLDPTGTGTIRDVVARLATVADGGVWPESTMYDFFTENFMVPGVVAVGSEHFPEYTALWKSMARYHIAEITPDLSENFRWGDNEERNLNNRRLNYRINVLWLLASQLGDAPEGRWCRWMATELSAKWNMPPAWRAYWLIDPYQPSEKPPETLAVDSSIAGVHLRKTPDELLGVTFHGLTGLQHQVERWGDFALYRGGEWVVDRPLGYAGSWLLQEWGNNVLLCGLGAMQDRKNGSQDGMIWGETSGQYYTKGYYNPPPTFVRNCRREITRDGVNAVLRDVIDMDDPRLLPNYARYAVPERNRMDNAPLIALGFNAPVAPTIEANAVSWKTAKGQTVRITWTDERTVTASQVLQGGEWGNPATWRIRLVPSGYKGGPIELKTRVEITN